MKDFSNIDRFEFLETIAHAKESIREEIKMVSKELPLFTDIENHLKQYRMMIEDFGIIAERSLEDKISNEVDQLAQMVQEKLDDSGPPDVLPPIPSRSIENVVLKGPGQQKSSKRRKHLPIRKNPEISH